MKCLTIAVALYVAFRFRSQVGVYSEFLLNMELCKTTTKPLLLRLAIESAHPKSSH